MRPLPVGPTVHLGACVVSVLLTWTSAPSASSAQSRPEAKDMALVGYHDLQARSAYQPTITTGRPLDRLHRPSWRHARCAQSRSIR